MESLVRVNGEVMPKREFIISLLKKGYTPQLQRKCGVRGTNAPASKTSLKPSIV